MLRIHTSHRTEVLLDAFVRRLEEAREQTSPFTPVNVVIPNGNVETYLRLGVAERLGIAANLEMALLRKFLAELAERAVPDARVADAAVVEGHLLALFHDDGLLARPDLASVRGYLFAAGSEPDAVDRRRCQLAEKLAHLFDEYAGTRADMLAAWQRGEGAAASQLQQWQRALWLEIFGADGRLARQGAAESVRWLPLPALWDEAMAAKPFSGGTLHVFGVSYIATAYHRMLAELARAAEINVYTLNPCREELADVRRSGKLPASEAAHLALELWARPGRENLRLLAGLAGATCESDFPEGDRATLLHRLQADIVASQTPAESEPPAALDGSLRVLPCPSPRRELEVVAAEIWRLLRAEPTLHASDIAVIVPERHQQLYLAQLPTVFGESCDLPHNVTDATAAGSHRVAEAIALLLELPFSAFSRKEFLPLLTHPCLMARFPGATPEDWRALAAELGIVRGADRRDFDPAYLQRDLYSWDQGLRRLALGAVADRQNADAPAPLWLNGQAYLPGPPVGRGDEAALGFGLLARSLIADAALAAGRTGPRERPLGEWLDFLRGLVRAYLVLDEDDGAGQAVVARFLAALDGLGDSGLGDTKVTYRVAALLGERALGGLPASRGHYLASGVTVASFVPMRAIPFRAVFVLGLGQDAFPRPPGRHELDLRAGDALPGDVDDRQQDLYMFLETLLSAREHICFSYVSRDEITGDELPASPALLELRSVLARGYLDRDALARLFCDQTAERPKLRRYDDTEERRAVLPVAEAERRARELGRALRDHLPAGTSVRKRLAALPDPLASSLARVLGLPALAPGPAPRSTPAIKISLATLRRFLEDPLQGSARFGLGMVTDDDEGLADVEDEPFDLDPLLHASLVRTTMASAILAAQGTPAWPDLEAIHERAALAAELAGRAPAGLYRAARANDVQQLLRAWHAELPAVIGAGPAECRRFRLVPKLELAGALDERGAGATVAHRQAPSFAVTIPARPGETAHEVAVTVVGETGLWSRGAGETALAFTTRKRVTPERLGKEDLWAFLDHVALAAAGGELERPGFRSVLFHAALDRPGQRAWRFGRLTAEVGRAYLRGLCGALLAGGPEGAAVHPYLLPHEAVLESWRKGSPVVEEIEALCAGEEQGDEFSSTRGPVPAATERYTAPPAAEAERMIAERFGLFFSLAKEGA